MANEASLNCSLQVRKSVGGVTVLDYSSRPTAFRVDVSGTKGPTPGAMAASVAGTDVDFSELTVPGLCRISNLSTEPTNYIEYGIFDPEAARYYPLGECDPGESYVIKLSRNFNEEYGTALVGTGTLPGGTARLRIRGRVTGAVALVEAFEK